MKMKARIGRKINGKQYWLTKKIATSKKAATRITNSLKKKGFKDAKAVKRVYGSKNIYLIYVRLV